MKYIYVGPESSGGGGEDLLHDNHFSEFPRCGLGCEKRQGLERPHPVFLEVRCRCTDFARRVKAGILVTEKK